MKYITILLFSVLTFFINAQIAPSHLKYFGFVAIDCFYDDPLDTDNLTNYISEIDSFSNIAHMCVYDPTDDISARVNLMNDHCVKPIIHFQSIFYEYVDNNGLGGENYDLVANFTARWNTFKTINATVFDTSKVAAFYIVDEPFWKGVTFAELDTVCSLINASFPDIPLMIIEASGAIASMQIPSTIDWLGFDEYGIFDPTTNSSFLSHLALLKSKKSDPSQDIFLVIDDQWLPSYGAAGYQPDTIRFMVQNYYNLAASDSDIIGLLGYLWPGGLDDPAQLGVRNMPQSVIAKNIEIGQKIKANYSPCNTLEVNNINIKNNSFTVVPNPSKSNFKIEYTDITQKKVSILIIDNLGRIVLSENHLNVNSFIQIDDLSKGFYSVILTVDNKYIGTQKIIIE